MKFQNYILINFVTDPPMDKPKAIYPFSFFKVGGIKTNADVSSGPEVLTLVRVFLGYS